MEPLFEKQKKKSTVDVVIESIWQLLLTKKVLPGQKLPSESEISEGLGVSRGSVREAMKILSAFGIVEIKVGDGTYIPAEPKSAIIDPLLFNFIQYNPDVEELSEFRRMIEKVIIELIILHEGENGEERQCLYDNFDELIELRKTQTSHTEFAKNDMAFHRLLGAACHNRMAHKIYDFVLDYLEQSILSALENQEHGIVTYTSHKIIVEAIRANDLELAKKAIDQSVEGWQSLQNKKSQNS